MLIPDEFDESMQQIYDKKLRDSIRKAKHLSERVKHFLYDIGKMKFREPDKNKIKDILLNKK
jgi:hypothetical protein